MTESIIKRFERTIKESWDFPAITNYGSGTTYTYGDIARAAACLHATFRELGIMPGDRIVLCDRNLRNWVTAMVGIITYGAVGVPLMTEFTDQQLINICEHSDAKFLFGGRRTAGLWEEGKCPMHRIDLSEVLRMASDDFGPEDVKYREENPDDLMILSYTSGSTGSPKGVMLPYRSFLSNAGYVVSNPNLPVHGRDLVVLPLAHMFGFTCDFLGSMLNGSHITILTKLPVPSLFLQAIKDVRPDRLYTVPLIMEKLAKSPNRDSMLEFIRESSVKEIIMGGASLNREAEILLHDKGIKYSVGYGMTECGPLICHSFWPDIKVGSCGRPVTGMEVRILSEDPQNIPGEILARGQNVMLGYYKNPEATAETLDAGGWLHTGDLGVVDSDGYLFIRGREKNMILTSNGQNIYPEEVEEQIITHSPFEESVVLCRAGRLIGLVYVSNSRLEQLGKSREDLDKSLKEHCAEINKYLPAFSKLAELVQKYEEFEKTPKRSIRRYLYR